jgi:ABC-type glutathione transport system ATPase component
MPLLEVRGLSKEFRSGLLGQGRVTALRDVDLDLERGETLGILGPSGSGKTTLGRCIMRLVEPDSGKIILSGRDITSLRGRELFSLGREMQMVFQNPEGSFDPRMRLRESLAEPLEVHGIFGKERIMEMARMVNLNRELLGRYPHQLSGGQLQRASLARALMLDPGIIVADEPTSMLDVLVQAQMLDLMREIQTTTDIGYIFISHDRKVVDHMCDSILRMDRGEMVG